MNISNRKIKGFVSGAFKIMFILLLVVGVYYGYNKYKKTINTKRQYLIENITDAKQKKKINKNSIPKSLHGNEFNINFWIYINDYRYRSHEDKIIVMRTTEDNPPTPVISLTKNINNLNIILETDDYSTDTTLEPFENNSTVNPTASVTQSIILPVATRAMKQDITTTAAAFMLKKNEYSVENIKLQRWVNISVGLSDYNLDIYIDGKMVKSVLTDGLSQSNKGDLVICPGGGFNGFISKLEYSNRILSKDEVYQRYLEGPH